jgi:hypothetical protein
VSGLHHVELRPRSLRYCTTERPQRLCRKQTRRRHGEDRASYWFKLYTKRTDTPSRGQKRTLTLRGRVMNREPLTKAAFMQHCQFAGLINVLPDGPMPVICMTTSPSFAHVKCGAFGGSE